MSGTLSVEVVTNTNTNENDENESNKIYILALVVTGTSLLMLGVVGYVLWRKLRAAKRTEQIGKIEMKMIQQDAKRLQEAWRLDWDQIKILNKLGQGGAGSVYRALINSTIPAAVKIMKNTDLNKISADENREIQCLMRIKHKRLVHFLGYGNDSGGSIFICLEICKFSLDNFCRGGEDAENAKQMMTWPTRIQIAIDIAEGCAYLHKSGIIHRDLKSGNVLLNLNDSKLRAKVADFGLSKLFGSPTNSVPPSITKTTTTKTTTTNTTTRSVDTYLEDSEQSNKSDKWSSSSSSHTTGVGSTFWMAPELISSIREDKGVYTPKIDVYAFGIIMHELLTLRRPYSDRDVMFTYKILNAVENGERPLLTPKIRAKAPEKYCDWMELCWHQSAVARPEFDVTFKGLSDILKKGFCGDEKRESV